jgi:transcription initiation factor IIE alpha subunit
MLTSGQCVVAAYMTDGGFICPSCASKRTEVNYDDTLDKLCDEWSDNHGGEPVPFREQMELRDKAEDIVRTAEEGANLRPLIQYELDSDEHFQENGLTCDDCDEVLVEADEPEDEEEEIEYTDEARELDEWQSDRTEERE